MDAVNIAYQSFCTLFNQFGGGYNKWETFHDFIDLSACAIANACDITQKEVREKHYMSLIGKYKKAEQGLFPKLLAAFISELEKNPEQDYLGMIYNILELTDKRAGQFFTPYPICACMAEMLTGNSAAQIEEQGAISVNDPACGAGATLIAFANKLKKEKVNYQYNVLFVAQDIDPLVAKMCYLQLSLLGCPGYVVIGDSLTGDQSKMEHWYTPFYFLYGRRLERRLFENQHKKKEQEIQVVVPVITRTVSEDPILEFLGM